LEVKWQYLFNPLRSNRNGPVSSAWRKTMFHRWAALLLVLALCAMSPKNAAGQQSKPRGQGASGFGNYPNPFNPETFFTVPVHADECTDGSQQHVVTLKIYNVLMQPIATPTLRVSATSVTPVPSGANSQSITSLRLGCGWYEAYWNGKMEGTGKEAPSGVYIASLIIDREKPQIRRIFLSK
jgi:hypothetical protein